MQSHEALSSKIKRLYTEPISDAEASEAAERLVSFIKMLCDIEKQNKAIATAK